MLDTATGNTAKLHLLASWEFPEAIVAVDCYVRVFVTTLLRASSLFELLIQHNLVRQCKRRQACLPACLQISYVVVTSFVALRCHSLEPLSVWLVSVAQHTLLHELTLNLIADVPC